MSDESSRIESQSVTGPSWLLEPEPSEARFQLNIVAEATQLTPEVLQALQHAMEQLQKVPADVAAAATKCPRLRVCGQRTGDCPRLVQCGIFDGVVSPTPCPTLA
jgi:hypothetical protein